MSLRNSLSFARLSLALCLIAAPAQGSGADAPVEVRAENLTVSPSTGPVTHVLVHNLLDVPFAGLLRVKFPERWKVIPNEQALALAPGATKRIPFSIERATDLAANSYPVEITVEGNGAKVARKQNLVCASAPSYKPEIDGDLKEWADSVPITFLTKRKKTVVRTYWNKRQFCVAVEVEEDALVARGKSPGAVDAVQFALSPNSATRTQSADGKTERYEFLAVASSGWFAKPKCFQLAAPGEPLTQTTKVRSLEEREVKGALVAIKRAKETTRYEIAVPYAVMEKMRPTVGRAFYFSLLVHDPDGTGVRNLGETMDLLPRRRNATGWSRWEGAKWGEKTQLDNRCEWGLASSIH